MQQKNYYQMYLEDCMLEAEIHDYFRRELKEAGYAGCTFRRSFNQVELQVRVAEPNLVYGENHERIHQIESILAQRLKLPLASVTIYCDKIIARGLSAQVLGDQLQKKIEEQTPIRQAAMFVIKSALRAGAAGCQVEVRGKLRQQRANMQKYHEGIVISSGKPGKEMVDHAIRHIPLKQGIIGIQIFIYNPKMRDQFGRQMYMPDQVEVFQ